MRSIELADALAIALLLGAGAAFALGQGALSRAEDLPAVYWLVVGIAALRAAVQIARPGAGA